MAVEKLDTTKVKIQNTADAEQLKLGAGEVIRNVTIVDINEGVSDYGAYTTLMLEDVDGELYSLLVGDSNVFGRNVIKKFTVGEEGLRMVNPALDGKRIFIGKSEPIQSKQSKNKTYMDLVWGYEE